MKIALVRDDVVISVVAEDQAPEAIRTLYWDTIVVVPDSERIEPQWVHGPRGFTPVHWTVLPT